MNDRTEAREESWFAPAWRLRIAQARDARAYFGGRISIAARFWAGAAALRWPATLLLAAAIGATYFGFLGGEKRYTAEATLAARRGGSAERLAVLSTREAAALRRQVASPALLESAARKMTSGGAPDRLLAKALGSCAEAQAASGDTEVRVVCRAGTAAKSVDGANALAAALAAAPRSMDSDQGDRDAGRTVESTTPGSEPLGRHDRGGVEAQRAAARERIGEIKRRLSTTRGAARADIETELARERALIVSLDGAAARQGALEQEAEAARRALGIAPVGDQDRDAGAALTLSVVQQAAAARRVVPWGVAAAAAVLAALALVGFVGRRLRGLRTVEEVSEIFRTPVLILERGGRANVC